MKNFQRTIGLILLVLLGVLAFGLYQIFKDRPPTVETLPPPVWLAMEGQQTMGCFSVTVMDGTNEATTLILDEARSISILYNVGDTIRK